MRSRLKKIEGLIESIAKPEIMVVCDRHGYFDWHAKAYGYDSYEELRRNYNVHLIAFQINEINTDPETGEIIEREVGGEEKVYFIHYLLVRSRAV